MFPPGFLYLDPCHCGLGQIPLKWKHASKERQHVNVPRVRVKQARIAVTSVIRACLLILVFAFGGVSSAEAHSPQADVNSLETAVSLTAHDACCHSDAGEVAMTTCAASTCCPAVSGIELAAPSALVLQNRAIRTPYSTLRHGLSTLPLIQPPILS
jgi:hypothetical protein